MTKRKHYSSAFKSKVVLEALRGELTLAELASKHGVHQKQQALDGLSEVFSEKTPKNTTGHEEEIKELHAKIGQLTVEKDFLERAFAKTPVLRVTADAGSFDPLRMEGQPEAGWAADEADGIIHYLSEAWNQQPAPAT